MAIWGAVAMVNPPVVVSRWDTDRLPIPLPISCSGAERSTAQSNIGSGKGR
ncbi:hypothetical protein KoxyNG13_047180 [Klebsiella pasteurii]